MRPCFLAISLLLPLSIGARTASAHPRSIGGHVAYAGAAVVESEGTRTESYLSLGLLRAKGGGQNYSGYGLLGLVGRSEAFVGAEYVSGWSSMFASTGAGVGPVLKLAEDPGVGAQGRLFGDLLGIHGSLGLILTYAKEPQAVILFSIGVGGAGSHTSFNQ